MDEVRFIPVRGEEEVILAMPYVDGKVYFATDTKRIYIDARGQSKIPMGGAGNSGIYYGTKTLTEEEKETAIITFTLAEIEGAELPNIDDLVLNASDGCFYRVVALNTDSFDASRLTVAGNGGGGEGGYKTKANVTIIKPSNTVFLYGQESYITITPNSARTEEGPMDDYLDLYWKVKAKDDASLYSEGVISSVHTGEPINFEFGSKLYANKNNILEFWVSGYNSGTMATHATQEVKCVQLSLLENDEFSPLKMYNGTATITCEVEGAIDKILEFWVDGQLKEQKLLDSSNQSQGRQSTIVTGLTHGTHSVEIKLYQSVNGEYGAQVPSLKYEIASKEEGNNTPIIWLGSFKDVYQNYEQIIIPYMAYNPTTGDTCTVRFYKNENELAISPASVTFSSETSEFETLEITNATIPEKVGETAYNTFYIYCGNTARAINFYVYQSGMMTIAAPSNLLVNFDASGRSNNESALTRDVWEYKGVNNNTYKGTFEGFNWYNNGWIKDADNKTCLRISNGAKFSIPLGATMFNGTDQGAGSHTFEFEFKIRNVQNYEKLIKLVTRYKYVDDKHPELNTDNDNAWYNNYVTNYQNEYDSYDQFLQAWLPTQGMSYDNLEYVKVESITSTDTAFCKYYDTVNNVGFCLGTQDAFFKTNKSTLNANYVENRIVNLTLVFSQSTSLVSIFLNGVLSGAAYVADTTSFTVNGPTIEFNSDFCDIDLYKFRVYNTGFAISEVLNNYSIDLRDTMMYAQSTALSKYNRDIKEYQLDYNAMITFNEENPDDYLMPYFVFSDVQGDALPYSKLDEKTSTMTFVNTGLDRLYATGELTKMAAAEEYPEKNWPIYWISRAELVEALSSETPTENYTVHLVEEIEGEIVDQGIHTLDMSKVNLAKCKRKANDTLCTIYRKLSSVENYYLHHGASFEAVGGETKTQGTSSQFYPRRNYKFKGKEKFMANRGPFEHDPFPMPFFYMDNDAVGTSTFTLKIDYMESSGSYNTGFANLVNNAYTKHPVDDYVKSKAISGVGDTTQLRTSVQGFPAMAFHKKKDGSYTYIGRYNMNIDKGSDECYGFKLFSDNDPVAGSKLKQAFVLDSKGKASKVADVVECWEFSDNNRGYCSFRDPLGRKELSFDYPAVSDNETDQAAGYHTNAAGSCPVVADSFEYRYHKDEDMLDYLYNPADPGLDIDGILGDYKTDLGTISDYTWRKEFLIGDKSKGVRGVMSNWEDAVAWVYSTCTDNVDSEDMIYQSYAVKSADLTSYYGTTTKRTYDSETGSFGSIDCLVFDVNVEEGKPVAEEISLTLAEAFLEPDFVISEGGTILLPDYGVVDPEKSTDEIEVLMLNNDGIFQAYADFNGYKYIDYYIDAEGHAVGRFITGKVKTREEVMNVIKQNTAEYATVRMEALASPYTAGRNTYYFDTKEYRLAKFKNEFTDHFDKEYALVYFVMTEVFMCYDSRGKNAMFASWGPQKEGGQYIWYPIFYDIDTQLGINNTGIPSFEYYVNASEDGCYSTNDSVLWGNIYKCFFDDIKSTYQALRTSIKRGDSANNTAPLGGSIEYFGQDPVEHIENWYTCNPDSCNSICMMGNRPLIAINFDEYYKYISIMNQNGPGYQGTDGTPKYDEAGSFLYALQGDRSLSRQQFLSRRINFVDSWLTKGNYAEGTGSTIKFRTSANDPENTSDVWVDNSSILNSSGIEVEGLIPNSGYYKEPLEYDMFGDPVKLHELDANFFVKLSPYQRSYVTLATDNAPLPSIEYEGSPVRLEFPANVVTGVRKSPEYAEQLLYLYGANYLKDIGDVSLLYPREFELKGATHLQRIILGNDTPGYKNKKLKSPQFDAAASKTGTTGKPLLKEVVFTNVQIDGNVNVAFDFSSSEKLQIFRALGMNLSGVAFADGVALHTLYLPATINELVLKEARNLTNLITEYKQPVRDVAGNWQAKRGLYIPGLTDATAEQLNTSASTSINRLQIAGGNMGYDSFDLLNRLYTIKERDGKTLAISLTDVNWTPFTKMVRGTIYDYTQLDNYYIDNEHYQLVPYKTYGLEEGQSFTFNQQEWDLALKNGVLYYKDSKISDEQINKLSDNAWEMLQRLATEKLIDGYTEKYTNTDETNNAIPRISGNIYINNVNEEINEGFIKNTLLTTWYPDLNIHFNKVKKAYSAKFVTMNDDGVSYTVVENMKVSQEDYADGHGVTWFSNPYNIPKLNEDMNKQGWDFFGWSTVKDNKNFVIPKEGWDAKTFENGVYEYTFYAVYEKHMFEFTFLNDDNSLISWEDASVEGGRANALLVTFGENLVEPPVVPNATKEKDLVDDRCYRFLGYARTPNGDVIDITQLVSTEDLSFYARYEEMSVYDNDEYINNPDKYFSFGKVNFNDSFDTAWNKTGYVITPKPGVQLTGKLLLPNEYKGEPIVRISGFSGHRVTHIFFDRNTTNELRHIASEAFLNNTTLEFFEFGDCVRTVGASAFEGCSALRNEYFGSNLADIQYAAFKLAFGPNKDGSKINKVFPGTICAIGDQAFQAFSTAIESVTFGSTTDGIDLPYSDRLGTNWIRQNLSRPLQHLTVYCADSTTYNIVSAHKDTTNLAYCLDVQIKLQGE